MTTTNIHQSRGQGSRDKHSATLLLFPLCDTRGWVSRSLKTSARTPGFIQQQGVNEIEAQGAENVFFAWLLDLPAGIEASAAAEALLLVNRVDPEVYPRICADAASDRSLVINVVGAEAAGGSASNFRNKMIDLLQRVGSTGSLYQ